MCLFVKEVPTSQRAGLVWPCWKAVSVRMDAYVTCPRSYLIPADGWLFPRHRSKTTDWYHGRTIDGNGIHASTDARDGGRWNTWDAYAVGVLAFGRLDLFARALFIPMIAQGQNAKRAAQTVEVLRQLSNGHGSLAWARRELFKLHPRLRYAVTGKR